MVPAVRRDQEAKAEDEVAVACPRAGDGVRRGGCPWQYTCHSVHDPTAPRRERLEVFARRDLHARAELIHGMDRG